MRHGAFRLAVHRFGNVAVAVQPARGYNVDPKATYHDPALVPPHAYLAFHIWLNRAFGAHAVVHVGKHGNLEWLPGKALALSETCFPEICAGPVPQLYPFIVNDPGEGTQAKRRIGAAIIDHLTLPHPRRKLWPAQAARGAGRRILSGGRHGPAPNRSSEGRDPQPRAQPGARYEMPAQSRTATMRSRRSTIICAS